MFCTFTFAVLLLKYCFALQILSYSSQADYNLLLPSYSQFCPNFVGMAMGSVREKCNWQHSMAHPRKPPYMRKNLAKISYTIRVIANFVRNFVAMATREGPG